MVSVLRLVQRLDSDPPIADKVQVGCLPNQQEAPLPRCPLLFSLEYLRLSLLPHSPENICSCHHQSRRLRQISPSSSRKRASFEPLKTFVFKSRRYRWLLSMIITKVLT